jgi:hypothetical protein
VKRGFGDSIVHAHHDRRVRIVANVRFASRVASAEGNASHSARSAVRAGALESASGGRFNESVLRARSRALRVRGMRSVRRDRRAKRVSGLRVSDRIAGTRNGVEARSASFGEVRERLGRIAVPDRSVRFVRVVRVIAKGLHRGRRSHFVRGLKADAKDLRHGHRSHLALGVRVKDLRHDHRSHLALGVRVKDLHRDHRSRFVLGLRVRGSRRGRRNRFGDVKRVARGGRSAEETIGLKVVVREGRAQSGLANRGLQGRRNSAERRSSAAIGSLRAAERLGLEASRSLDREQEM